MKCLLYPSRRLLYFDQNVLNILIAFLLVIFFKRDLRTDLSITSWRTGFFDIFETFELDFKLSKTNKIETNSI